MPRYLNLIDEMLHRSECIRPDGTPAISLRRLREYIRNSAVVIDEDELQAYLTTHKSYSAAEITDICNKVYRPTPQDERGRYYIRLK